MLPMILSLAGVFVLFVSIGIMVSGKIRSIRGKAELREKMESAKFMNLFGAIGCALIGISNLLTTKYGWAALFFGLSTWDLVWYWHSSNKLEVLNRQDNPDKRE